MKRVLVIAEIGQNHNGDMELARQLITAAKENGADIAKFQLYNVDSIFPPTFEWYKEAKQAQLSREQVSQLNRWCQEADIEFMASVFDTDRVQWCQDIAIKRYKIASRSIYDRKLRRAIAATGKDIIVSLGMSRGKRFPRINTTGKVDFLYCVAKYPTSPENLNFLKINFNKYSGFSDHTIGIEAALVAMSRGAGIIEKHFTLDKNMHGPDHHGSMEPDELREIVNFSKKIGRILYHPVRGE